MNFDDAIKSHTMWKMKLASYITKPDHSLNASVVASDGNCELGKWLQGEGRKHASLPEFSSLASNHTRFHKAAGAVITKADSGQNVSEEIALGGRSEYASASSSVVSSLMAIKSKVH